MKSAKILVFLFSLFTMPLFSQEHPKKDKRFIHPRSIFVETGGGFFYGLNLTKDAAFRNKALASWQAFAKVEIGLKNNFYAEFSGGIERYWQAISPLGGFTFGSNAFFSGKFSIGAGYRIILPKTNYYLANIHLGMSTSYQRYQGLTGSGAGKIFSATSYFEYNELNFGVRKLFPTFYIGIQKDFQLSKNFYLSLSYRYDQGLATAYETSGQYRTNPNAYFTPFYYKINGTAHSYSLGFKYKFSASN
jgi:hypothetical protein